MAIVNSYVQLKKWWKTISRNVGRSNPSPAQMEKLAFTLSFDGFHQAKPSIY